MSLTHKIITSALSMSFSNFIVRLLSFFSVVFIVRGLSLREYGILTLGMAITGPIAVFAGLGLDGVFVADTSKYIGEKKMPAAKRFIISFIRNKIIITIAMLIVGWFMKEFLEERYGSLISAYFFWLSLWVIAQSLRAIIDLLAQIYERFIFISCINIIEVCVKLGLVLFFLATGGLNIFNVLLIYTISRLVSFVVGIVPIAVSLYDLKDVTAEKRSIMFDIIKKHGKWEIARHILNNITNNIKPWFIKIFLNTESVAIYSLSQTVFSAVSQLLPLKNIIMPIVAKRINNKNISALIMQKVNKYSLFLYIIMIIGFLFIGQSFILLFFPQYLSAVPLIKLMLLVLLPTTITSSQYTLFYGLHQQKFMLFGNDLISILSRLLLPLWIWIFGLNGVALEMICAPVISAVWMERYLRTRYQMVTWKWKDMLVFDSYDRWLAEKIWEKIPFHKIKHRGSNS